MLKRVLNRELNRELKSNLLVILSLTLMGAASPLLGETLFKYQGKAYQAKDLEAKHQLKLFEADNHRHQIRTKVLEDAVLDIYFASLAKKSGKSVEDIRKEKTEVGKPSEDSLKKFYEENRKKIPYPFEQVKADLIRFVTEKNRQEKRGLIMAEIKKSGKFKPMLKAPVAPKISIGTAGFQSKGNAKSKVTVVEFADYKCPHCKEAAHVFKEVLKKYGSKIHFVFIDYPIIGDSYKIAEGAFCAGKQKKYWEYHEAAFESQGKAKSAVDIAKIVKLDEKSFKTCTDAREGKAIVEKGRKEGEKVGVTGTPTVYINGIRYSKGYNIKDLAKAIDDALAGKSAS
jgi:protein-disulfide isomerase